VNELAISIEKFIKSGFKDNNALNASLLIYQNLDAEEKRLLGDDMYTIFRGKFDLCFTSAQYNESLEWLHKTKENSRFARELPNNKAHFLVEAVKSLLMTYLENNDDKLMTYAKTLFGDIVVNDLENDTLRGVFQEVRDIILDDKQKKLWTRTSFSVPIAMKTIENEVTIDIPYKNDKLQAIVSVQSTGLNGESVNISKKRDHDSIIGSSTWTIRLNKYLSCEEISDDDGTASVMQFYVCNIVNRIIDAYREQTGEYWVKSIYPSMISSHSIKYGVGSRIIRDIPLYDRGEYQLSTKPLSVNLGDEYIKEIIPLYKSLLMEAKSYLLSEALRESVISLNSAFENFTYTVICPLIIANSNGEYNQNFYLKVQSYQDYFLRDYLTEDEYADAVEKGVIKARGMSTYAIYKIFHGIFKDYLVDLSKTKLNKLISVIRNGRNELTHGNPDFGGVSANVVKRQITTFEELIGFVQSAMDQAGLTYGK